MVGTSYCGWSRRKAHLAAAIVAAFFFCLAAEAIGQEPAVVRVEEDWEVQIGVPDPDNNAPQIINVIAPLPGIMGPHAVFELNHRTFPKYIAGGMQLQYWNGDLDFGYCCGPHFGMLTHDNEVIRYTLSMSLAENALTFQVRDGTSTTWGAFGGQESLKLSVNAGVTSLDTYDFQTSLKYSRVGFSPNRVTAFVLREVRLYSADGQLVSMLSDEDINGVATPGDISATP